jgi:[ribosomal protein S5]-alanine N-acetyltransferase
MYQLAILRSMATIFLPGSRIIVTDMIVDDVAQYYEWFWESDPQTMTCRPIKRWEPDKLIAHMQEHFEKRDVLFLSVRTRDESAFAGRITLFDHNEANRSIELGYMLGPPYRGRGLMQEALTLVLAYAFAEMHINKVHAQTGEFNGASIALLERLGFRRDGQLRQHHLFQGKLHDDLIYSLLASEFTKSD